MTLPSQLRRLTFNGKFYAGELNGVHRVADRLIREIDARLAALPAADRPHARLLLPERRQITPQLQVIRLEPQRLGHNQIWEQFILPFKVGGDVLVNLCNLAPIAAPRKLLLLHDAQFLFPDNGYPTRRRLGYKWLIPLMARTSTRMLTVSEYSRQIIDLTGIRARASIGVLHNGADHITETETQQNVASRFGIARRQFVLMFGSTKGYKNIAIVFDAFRSRDLEGVSLLVVGEGREALTAAGFRIPANAVFTGSIADDELRSLYENAICLVFPSRTEGFGLPPLEAMSVGCPAVVAPAGAMPETCHDAAVYAGVDQPSDWVRAICRLRDDDAYRDARIALGLTRARQFTWARAGDQLLDELLVLARRGG